MFHPSLQVMPASYSLRAHDLQLREEYALRLSNSTQIPTSKPDPRSILACDLASTVVQLDNHLRSGVLQVQIEKEIQDETPKLAQAIRDVLKIPVLSSVAKSSIIANASRIIDRTATAAAGKIVYRYADAASKVVLVPELVVFNSCSNVPQQQTNPWPTFSPQESDKIVSDNSEKTPVAVQVLTALPAIKYYLGATDTKLPPVEPVLSPDINIPAILHDIGNIVNDRDLRPPPCAFSASFPPATSRSRRAAVFAVKVPAKRITRAPTASVKKRTSARLLSRPIENLKGQGGRSTTSRSTTLFGLKGGVRVIPDPLSRAL